MAYPTRPPYCANCGHTPLTAAQEVCPGCGLPRAEVWTEDPTSLGPGRRYRSDLRLWGLPLVDIAQGPYGDEKSGMACGIIAVGDRAAGVVAVGGLAFGFVALGGLPCGIIVVGGAAFGLIALAGFALGGLTVGGAAAGLIAKGGAALGYYAQGGGAFGRYVIDSRQRDPEAVQAFADWAWLLGSQSDFVTYVLMLTAFSLLLILPVALLIGALIVVRLRRAGYRLAGQANASSQDEDGS